MAVITLLTDFQLHDPYAAILHGVILGINPAATIVDLTHLVSPQDVDAAALLLQQAYAYFPRGTIHVVVVDPGVGSERRAVAVRIPAGILVAPDNGVLTSVLAEQEVLEAVVLQNPRYRLPQVSNTFHGRDVFAPAAAYLSRGAALAELGPPAGPLVMRPSQGPRVDATGCIHGHVIHVDGFGNLITNITASDLQATAYQVRIAGACFDGVHATYASVAPGALVALIGSSGRLEVALRDGSAARLLGAGVGAAVAATPLRGR